MHHTKGIKLVLSNCSRTYIYLTEHGFPYGQLINYNKNKTLSDDSKKLKMIQTKAAWIESITNLIRLSFGLATVLIIGYISDRFGRKVALSILVFGEALYIGLMSVIVLFNLNPWTVVFPGLFEGILGGGLVSITAQISACLADITGKSEDPSGSSTSSVSGQQSTSKEHRWLYFTFYESLSSLSHSCGSLFGGILVHRWGFGVAIAVCIALYATSAVGLLILPETNPDVLMRKNIQESIITIRQNHEATYTEEGLLYLEIRKNRLAVKVLEMFLKMLNSIRHSSPLSRIVMTLLFSISITVMADFQYIYIYLMGAPFYWNAQTVGLYAGVSDILSACLSITFTVGIYNWEKSRISHTCSSDNSQEYVAEYNYVEITLKEMRVLFIITAVIFVGFSFMLINRILMGIGFLFTLPSANYVVYGASVARLVKNMLIAPNRTILSLTTPIDKQGFILSLGAFIVRVGFLISSTIFPLIYAGTVNTFPGTVFFVCAFLISLTICFAVLLPMRLQLIQEKMKSLK
ncbi:adenylate cyclase [Schistosoma japonicum]|nr:adenylate cyclase [Schistosoma japonicum]